VIIVSGCNSEFQSRDATERHCAIDSRRKGRQAALQGGNIRRPRLRHVQTVSFLLKTTNFVFVSCHSNRGRHGRNLNDTIR